ncbi:MAG: hypothetical protein ACREL1_05505, partial [bacterium]
AWTPPKKPTQGLYDLGIIPVNTQNRTIFKQWQNYYVAVQKIDFDYINTPTGQPETRVLQNLLKLYASVPDDPFLQSCFFEKLFFYYSFEKTFYPEDSQTNFKNFGGVLKKSFEKSLRDWVVREKYAGFLYLSGRSQEARRILEPALRSNPGNPILLDEWNRFSKSQRR